MIYIDWIIVLSLLAFITFLAISTRKYTASVADFLAANRCAGRYIICVASGAAGFGAISFVAMCEMYYSGGFSAYWWGMMLLPVMLITNLTGWVIYRYRQTRAMTLAQFFEMRYNRQFRVFSGIVCFISGVLNFGIFPAVSANFIIYFCQLPHSLHIGGLSVSSFFVLMLILNGMSLLYTFLGGQIAIIVTEFVQGILCASLFVIISFLLLSKFSWPQIAEGLSMVPQGQSLLHPFKTSNVHDFNVWYFLIAAFAYFYNCMGWQGAQAFNCSAKSAHEQKMATILGNWRTTTITLGMMIMPVCAYVVMNHPAYCGTAQKVTATLSGIDNVFIRVQMITPSVLAQILPHGIIGLLCGVIIAAVLSTNASYMHSWGSIFVQDVFVVLSKRTLTPASHLKILRLSISGVALFSIIFGLIFEQNQQIFMFFAITGAIFLGGSGAAIVGGLYWNRGTTAAAFSAMIVGSFLAVFGMVLDQMWSSVVRVIAWVGQMWPSLQQYEFISNPWARFPINGQWMYLTAMLTAIFVYIVVSLCGKTRFNMDQLLHRGQYAIHTDDVQQYEVSKFLQKLGMGKEFSFADRCVYISVLVWNLGWWGVFLAGIFYNCIQDVSVAWWSGFWHIFVIINIIASTATTIWLATGGFKDLKAMFKNLRITLRDAADDGTVAPASNTGKENGGA